MMEAVVTKLIAWVGLLVLALAAIGCTPWSEPGPSPSPASGGRVTSATLTSTGTSLNPGVSSWRVFTSMAGRYRLRYPPEWKAKESAGSGGPVLSLLPPKGSGITVLVTFTTPPEAEPSNLPNTQCRPILADGLKGSRCLDTVSMVVSTILQGRERWYVVTTSLRRPAVPAGAYDRVLASFRLT
jgi:hypothetical protein